MAPDESDTTQGDAIPLPCPFCGLIPEIIKHRMGHAVLLHKPRDRKWPVACFLPNLVEEYPTARAAINAWNKRAPVAVQP